MKSCVGQCWSFSLQFNVAQNKRGDELVNILWMLPIGVPGTLTGCTAAFCSSGSLRRARHQLCSWNRGWQGWPQAHCACWCLPVIPWMESASIWAKELYCRSSFSCGQTCTLEAFLGACDSLSRSLAPMSAEGGSCAGIWLVLSNPLGNFSAVSCEHVACTNKSAFLVSYLSSFYLRRHW